MDRYLHITGKLMQQKASSDALLKLTGRPIMQLQQLMITTACEEWRITVDNIKPTENK